MKKVNREDVEKSSAKHIGFGLAGGLLALLLFFSGALAGGYFFSWNSTESAKLKSLSDVLESRWYYADQFENLDEALLALGVDGTAQAAGDPYTSYLSNEENSAMNEKLSGVKKGIGIDYIFNSSANALEVLNVYLDSPSYISGIQAGDLITAVDGQSIDQLDLENLPEQISQSDSVALSIERNGQPLEVEVIPNTFNPTVALSFQDGAARILIRAFANDTASELKKALQKAKEQNVENIIIDLRNNTGGYVDAGIEAAGYLIGGDQVVFYDDLGDGVVDTYKTSPETESFSFDHIYILQNGETASAAEMFIAALKDTLNDNVTTIGQTTYGKGTVQDRQSFSDGTTLKYTRSLWKRPNGEYLNEVGITPDIETELAATSVMIVPDQDAVAADTVHVNAPAVQKLLQYLGYPADRTDNYFSFQSSQALEQFQQDYGLEVSGSADQAVLDALLAVAKEKASSDSSDLELEQAFITIKQTQ